MKRATQLGGRVRSRGGWRARLVATRWTSALWGVFLILSTGCGGTLYAVEIARASDTLARAEQLGASSSAPYDYHFALEHLRQARVEAARAEYGDARRLAAIAYEYATRAVHVAERVAPLTAPAVSP